MVQKLACSKFVPGSPTLLQDYMSVPNLKWIALFLQKLLGDVRRKSNEIANFHTARVFNAPADGVPLGILYRRRGLRKLE